VSDLRARLHEDGFVIVPRFLDEGRVQRLRAIARRAEGTRVGGGRVVFDLARTLPELYALVTDPETIELARTFVGDRVLHLHQNALHHGAVNRGWHKDDYGARPDEPDYRLVHFAWYLQEHVEHGGGISFRRGSHRMKGDETGEIVTPRIGAGDLVAFDLRTTHFGNVVQLRSGRPVYLDRVWRSRRPPWKPVATLTRMLPQVFRPEHGDERQVLFAMYGADDAHTARFFAWLRTQPDLRHVLAHDAPAVLRT
jgi:hypothetical protein